jgi:N-hydroxyarylamine O-acetyltransferase
MVLRVDLGGRPFIVDAGFGGLTLTGPLRLEADVEQQTPHETFRLREWEPDQRTTPDSQLPRRPAGVGGAAPTFVLEARLGDDWRPLYRFDLQPQLLADYQVTNWYLCHAPTSHFLSTLVVARTESDRRFNLRNTELAIRHRDGYTERRVFATVPELRDALDAVFGIAVPRGDALDEALARIVATSPAVPS